MASLAEKYGGPKAVFQALKAHTNYAELTNRISKAKSELDRLKTGINKLDAKYSHLKSAIAMCDSLIHEHNLGLDAVATTLSIAKKYGEPINVLRTLDTYGSLKMMTEELGEVEGQVQEREKLLHQLEGQYQSALKQLESLNAIAMKAGAEVSKVESRLDESKHLQKVMALINDPASAGYSEYGPLVVAVVEAVLKWVSTHEKHFLYPHSMKSTLQSLLKELGGD